MHSFLAPSYPKFAHSIPRRPIILTAAKAARLEVGGRPHRTWSAPRAPNLRATQGVLHEQARTVVRRGKALGYNGFCAPASAATRRLRVSRLGCGSRARLRKSGNQAVVDCRSSSAKLAIGAVMVL